MDTTALDTIIDSAIDGNNNPVLDGNTTSSNSITFTFSGNPSEDVDHFVCTITLGEGEIIDPCTSPQTFSGLADGTYTFTVAAVDGVGNEDPTPASFTWTVDKTAPDTLIDSAIDGNNNPVGNGNTTSSNSITFTFSGIPTDDVDHFVCTITLGEGEIIDPCTSPKEFTDLADGTYNFTVAAVDGVGNVDPTPASLTWTVDTTPPDTTIDSAIDGNNSPVANGRYYFI